MWLGERNSHGVGLTQHESQRQRRGWGLRISRYTSRNTFLSLHPAIQTSFKPGIQQPCTGSQSPLEEGRRSEAFHQQRPSDHKQHLPCELVHCLSPPSQPVQERVCTGTDPEEFQPKECTLQSLACVKTTQANGQQPKEDLLVLSWCHAATTHSTSTSHWHWYSDIIHLNTVSFLFLSQLLFHWQRRPSTDELFHLRCLVGSGRRWVMNGERQVSLWTPALAEPRVLEAFYRWKKSPSSPPHREDRHLTGMETGKSILQRFNLTSWDITSSLGYTRSIYSTSLTCFVLHTKFYDQLRDTPWCGQ